MATARHVVGKLKSSDGRIKVATASGVLALVAALALLVVLPVSAAHVAPSVSPGNPDCTVLNADDFLFEHKQDPPANATIDLEHNGLEGSLTVTLRTQAGNEVFDFEFSGDFVASAVIVKGGPDANLYDYRQVGGADADTGLKAPIRAGNRTFGLSHISFCIDEADATVEFVCDEPQTLDGAGVIDEVTAVIFANSQQGCDPETPKGATFTLVNDIVTLAFHGDGGLVAGRMDFFKQFGDLDDVKILQYDGGPIEGFVDLPWCSIGGDPDEQFEELDSGYPQLPTGHTACRVFESLNAEWTQHTVVYFEFEDPNFR